MRAIMERIEYSWWSFHIRILDSSPWMREVLPKLKEAWDAREEAEPYLVLSVLGFPLGVLIGLLSVYLK